MERFFRYGFYLAIQWDDVEKFALLTQLDEQRIRQTGAWDTSGVKDFSKGLGASLSRAIPADSPDIFRCLIEEKGMDPNEATNGYDLGWSIQHLESRTNTALEAAIRARSWKVAQYLLENTNPLHLWSVRSKTPPMEHATLRIRLWTHESLDPAAP